MRLALILWAATLAAQTAAPTASTLPQNWYGAGAQFSFAAAAGTARTSGWAGYAHLVSEPAQLYSFSVYNAYFSEGTNGRYQPITTASTGVMFVIRQFGPVAIFAFGTAGMASAGTLGNSFPYGALVDVHIGKTLWHAEAGLEEIPSSAANVPTQKSVILGFGRTF